MITNKIVFQAKFLPEIMRKCRYQRFCNSHHAVSTNKSPIIFKVKCSNYKEVFSSSVKRFYDFYHCFDQIQFTRYAVRKHFSVTQNKISSYFDPFLHVSRNFTVAIFSELFWRNSNAFLTSTKQM